MRRSLIVILALTLYLTSAPNHVLAQSKASPVTVAPVWALDDQKTTLTEQLPNVPVAAVKLDAAEVDKMIEALAQMRAEMKPPRPIVEPAPGTKINVATVGRWYVQPDGNGIVLAILHPGYGWVGLYLDPNSIEQLSRRLPRPVHARAVRARH
ncbi:MAG TPA: hypothetical protein VGR45_05750 [Stellaceae bacterium]|nr:hypothetical protein [Stellaceae bacterium]